MYKQSHYNHIHPWGQGNYLAYNALSGAVGMMDEENLATFKSILAKLEKSEPPQFEEKELELIQQLQYGKFIYPDYYDELDHLKFQHNVVRYDTSTLGYSIAPTLACNMACPYCYEENKKGLMQPDVVEAILNHAESQAIGLREVDINWYGGEPLLAMDIIEDITESILDLAREYKFRFGASMVTNGYLLKPETVDRLKDLRINTIQITLDGPARIHNKKRPLKNGKESFHTILENYAYAVDKVNMSIRVNIDKSFTAEMIEELLLELESAGLRDKARMYFGKIDAATSVCSNIYESCYDNAGFSQTELEFCRLMLSHGFQVGNLPSPMATACFSQIVNSHLIDPEGEIYRCYNFVGDKAKSMGNIKNPLDYNHPNFHELFDFNPFEDESCKACNILPVCMGGCPAYRKRHEETPEAACQSWKHNLLPMLELIAASRQRQAQSVAKE